MKHTLQVLAMATCLLAQNCFSQDKEIKSDLLAGLAKFAERDVALVGAVEEQAPGAPALAGGVQQVVVMGIANRNEHYLGDIEVLTKSEGQLVLVSKEDLPGIKIYKHDDDIVCLQAHTEEPFSLKQLTKNITHLANWKSLSDAVKKSSEIQSNGKGKTTEVRVVIDKDFIPNDAMVRIPQLAGAGAGNIGNVKIAGGPLQPTVVELVVTFSLNSTKEIVGLTYELQYDQPMAKFMKAGAVAMIQIDGAAKAPKIIEKNKDEGDEPASEEVLGEKVIYDFDVVAAPSKKAADFSEQAQAMLNGRK